MPAGQATAGTHLCVSRWSSPVGGRLKMNVDAAVSEDVAKWSARTVLRDVGGLFCASKQGGSTATVLFFMLKHTCYRRDYEWRWILESMC